MIDKDIGIDIDIRTCIYKIYTCIDLWYMVKYKYRYKMWLLMFIWETYLATENGKALCSKGLENKFSFDRAQPLGMSSEGRKNFQEISGCPSGIVLLCSETIWAQKYISLSIEVIGFAKCE